MQNIDSTLPRQSLSYKQIVSANILYAFQQYALIYSYNINRITGNMKKQSIEMKDVQNSYNEALANQYLQFLLPSSKQLFLSSSNKKGIQFDKKFCFLKNMDKQQQFVSNQALILKQNKDQIENQPQIKNQSKTIDKENLLQQKIQKYQFGTQTQDVVLQEKVEMNKQEYLIPKFPFSEGQNIKNIQIQCRLNRQKIKCLNLSNQQIQHNPSRKSDRRSKQYLLNRISKLQHLFTDIIKGQVIIRPRTVQSEPKLINFRNRKYLNTKKCFFHEISPRKKRSITSIKDIFGPIKQKQTINIGKVQNGGGKKKDSAYKLGPQLKLFAIKKNALKLTNNYRPILCEVKRQFPKQYSGDNKSIKSGINLDNYTRLQLKANLIPNIVYL